MRVFSPLEVHPGGDFSSHLLHAETPQSAIYYLLSSEGALFLWYFENMGDAPAVFSILITLLIPVFRRFLHAPGARLSQNRAAGAAERGSARFRFDSAYFDTLFFFF